MAASWVIDDGGTELSTVEPNTFEPSLHFPGDHSDNYPHGWPGLPQAAQAATTGQPGEPSEISFLTRESQQVIVIGDEGSQQDNGASL